MAERRFQFPDHFIFGAATAAAQIEGAAASDGRSASIWDSFSRVPGAVAHGHTPDEACRHYERWRQDLDLIRDLGVQSYRFSIAWPRIVPAGQGSVNSAGLDFYERIVDGLLARGIKPNATLYHWDLPQALQDRGGWSSRETVGAFTSYAEAVLKRLGDRVDFWATFNEPQVFVHLGYEHGIHAPGLKLPRAGVLQVIHHVLLAHGGAMQVIRKHAKPGAQAGIVYAPGPIWPATDKPADVAAAERHWRRWNDWWVQPILKGDGGYPQDVLQAFGADAPHLEPGDRAQMAQGLDFLGLNYYTPDRVADDPALAPLDVKHVGPGPNADLPDFPGWENFAPGLQNLITQFWRRYQVPLYVTENGTPIKADAVGPDGRIRDERRIQYLREHLTHCHRALEAGADLRGYYAWSLMDNFEWAFGYDLRFGLVHVDYETYKRTPKDSFAWYRELCRMKAFDGPELPDIRSAFESAPVAS
jgi:beta-glucosidase